MKLKEFLLLNNIKKITFSKETNLSRTSIYKLLNNIIIPSKNNFKNIFLLTNGAVEPNDFFPIEEWKKELIVKTKLNDTK